MRKIHKNKIQPEKFTLLPHVMISAPLFPPMPQNEGYSLKCGDMIWTVGCQNLAKYKRHTTAYNKGFDIRHFDLIAVLIEQHKKGNLKDGKTLRIGFSGLLRLINKTTSGSNVRTVSLLVDDLLNTFMSLEIPGQDTQVFRVLSSIGLDTKNDNILSFVTLST